MKGPGEIRGIAGLQGREPVAAVLRVGVKDRRGVPVDKDRFFFANPVERNGTFVGSKGEYQAVHRPLHPDFTHYHAQPAGARKQIQGVLVHATAEECWEYSLGAQALPPPWPAHPDRAPACKGNGVVALRFFGAARPQGFETVEVDPETGYAEIPCPASCVYRKDQQRTCRPKGRFLFRLDQEGLPPVIVRIATQSWYTVSVIVGFFAHVEEQAGALNAGEVPNLYGLPFLLTLEERTTPKGTFPVVTMTPRTDLQRWLLTQRHRLAAIQGRPLPQVPRLQDPDQQAARLLDFEEIEPTRPPPALPAPETYPPPQRLLDRLLEAQTAEAVDAVVDAYARGVEAARKDPQQRARLKAQAESLAAERKEALARRKPPLSPEAETLRKEILTRAAQAEERPTEEGPEDASDAGVSTPLPPPQALPEPLDWIRRAGATATAGDVAALELEAAPHLVRYHPDDVKKIRAAFTSAKKRAANASKTATGQFGLSATEAADQ